MADGSVRYPWERLVYSLDSKPPYRDPNGWVSGEPGGRAGVALAEFGQDLPVIVLLGERGVGKSDIVSDQVRQLEASGADCRFLDLPELGPRAARINAALAPVQSDAVRFVLLDSLDEWIDEDPGAWQILAACLRDMSAESRSTLRLRIACRSSRWPSRLRDALEAMWPRQVTYLGVAGLTRADVVMAATLSGLDASFVEELEKRRLVVPLASSPVTLKPLLNAAVRNLPLPANTLEAFGQACEQLCTETNPARRDQISAGHPAPADLLAAGRRVAAALQFGVASALADLDDEGAGLPIPLLARGSEPDGAGRQVACTEHQLRKLTESALVVPLGPRRWGFAHLSFQEFLAAQYVETHRVPAQVRTAILLAGEGRTRHVIPAQREVAAWLAVSDDGLFEEILVCDPQVLLLADPAVRPAADRRRLTEALLDLARLEFTVQLDPLALYRLDHPGLAAQLAPRLTADRPPNELYAALLIARACPQPALTQALMALAGNPELSDSLRSLAIEAAIVDSPEAASDLLKVTAGAPADISGAVLACLWPRHMSTYEMLRRLPRPQPNRLAAAWGFLHALPRRLRAADLADVLDWIATDTPADSSRDHTSLAIEMLAWTVRVSGPSTLGYDAPPDDIAAARIAKALISLIQTENFHEPGTPLDSLDTELAARPAFRRAVARRVLETASASDVGDLTFSSSLRLFPPEDTGYWAAQLPSLAPETGDKLRFPLRNPPCGREELESIWELAQADERVRDMTSHWYVLPLSHPLADDARRRREAEKREQARRSANRYDQASLDARLAALATGEVPARQSWAEVIIDLHRPPDGDDVAFDHSLDLTLAPSFPAPGSEFHQRLVLAASAALRKAPLITADQIQPARMNLLAVPELCALSLLAESGNLDPANLDADRWAGITLALIFVPTVPRDQGLRSQLIATGLAHSGSLAEDAIPRLLEPLSRPQLIMILDRLMPARTAGLAVHLTRWAQDPGRDPGQREAVLDALAGYGDQDVLAALRRTIPITAERRASDPGSEPGQRWLSNAFILARHDTAVSMPVISAALEDAPALARPFLLRLSEASGLGGWPMNLTILHPRDLADLYDLICTHATTGDVPLFDKSGAGLFGPDQQLQRMRSQLADVIASLGTPDAAGQLRELAGRCPDHWQLVELARHASRELAGQAWRPLQIEDLLRLADDGALRLVRDEHQLRDVVIESIERLQHLISVPNGWVTALWHKNKADPAGGWWPIWEDDLSDFVATFLQHDLAGRQVIVNREVQIMRPGLHGHRTDIHVQASPVGTQPGAAPLTVIIECKGCWNADLDTALSAQLVAKYLSTPGRNSGIYLIGYFDNTRWDHSRHPGREHSAHQLEDIRAEQSRIAGEEAARKSVSVAACVIDCRLPAEPSPASP